MKILKLLLVITVLCFFMTTSSFSSTILTVNIDDSTYDIGDVDTFIDSEPKGEKISNSDPESEISWINGILIDYGVTTYDVDKIEDIPIYLVTETDTESDITTTSTIYAVDLSSSVTGSGTDYFIVKNSNYWALYENLADINWGVFDTADLPVGMRPGDDLIVSHVTLANSGSADGSSFPNPEPSTLLLFGTGLLGLAKISRRKKSL